MEYTNPSFPNYVLHYKSSQVVETSILLHTKRNSTKVKPTCLHASYAQYKPYQIHIRPVQVVDPSVYR